jgi:endonuclease/exonuclease/phosphatase family metal-dependent hydrolase
MNAIPPLRNALRFRAATWNVHKAVGSDGRRDPERIAEVVAEMAPRVLVLQEVDRRLPRKPIFAPDAFAPLMPAATFGRLLGWHGNAVLVRDAEATRVCAIGLPGGEPRGALVVDLRLREGADLRICALHLGLLRRHRRLQIQRIGALLATLPPMPLLVAGDLNERSDGPASPLSLLDAFLAPEAPRNTFPAAFPILPLDRLRACGTARVEGTAIHATPLARRASDHLPLLAEVALPRSTPAP